MNPLQKFKSALAANCGSFAWLMVSCGLTFTAAAAQTNQAPAMFPAGQVIDSVQCLADSTQSYALYLPSNYTPAKTWPILYAFDPSANGKAPVKLYKDIAEKYGYIIAASNNSRNFQAVAASRGPQSVWEDTHARLALDPRRIYMMGFSGGARVATTLAIRCEPCAVAGVISHGAGYSGSFPASEKDRFAYFAFVGDQDFNWPEVIELGRKKEEWGASYRLRVFPGEHQWAPPAIFEEAIAWMQLKAMQVGSAVADASFINGLFARAQKEAEDAAQRKDALDEFEAYRSLVSDFSGLKEVSQYQEKLTIVKNSAEMKQALKKEQEAVAQQRLLTQEISAQLSHAADADPDTRISLQGNIVDGMTGLRSKADHARNEETRLVLLRAFNALWVQGIEAGQSELENKHFLKADYYFELMSRVSPNEAWPVLLLAESSAARGDKKRALKDLHEAVKRGLKNPDAIEKDANLETLRTEPEFQQILGELKANRDSQTAR
jgi:dienelactone hydrolase